MRCFGALVIRNFTLDGFQPPGSGLPGGRSATPGREFRSDSDP
jgi:hypothetical protein